jgi:hypothetical protein
MLILAGPVKVDLIIAELHAVLPAWQVTAVTLPGIDARLWGWMLWLAAKQHAGKADLTTAELAKLHEHLLAPLGVAGRPATPSHHGSPLGIFSQAELAAQVNRCVTGPKRAAAVPEGLNARFSLSAQAG